MLLAVGDLFRFHGIARAASARRRTCVRGRGRNTCRTNAAPDRKALASNLLEPSLWSWCGQRQWGSVLVSSVSLGVLVSKHVDGTIPIRRKERDLTGSSGKIHICGSRNEIGSFHEATLLLWGDTVSWDYVRCAVEKAIHFHFILSKMKCGKNSSPFSVKKCDNFLVKRFKRNASLLSSPNSCQNISFVWRKGNKSQDYIVIICPNYSAVLY